MSERSITIAIRYVYDSTGIKAAQNQINQFASQATASIDKFTSSGAGSVGSFAKSAASHISGIASGPVNFLKDQVTKLAEHFKWASLFIGAALVKVAQDILNTAATFEKFSIATEYLTGSTEEANKFAQAVRNLATNTVFGMDQIAELGKRLVGNTRDVAKSETALKALTDAVAATGGGYSELEGSVRAYMQMNSKAKVSAEELNRQFSNQNIPVIRVLAESIVKDLNHPLRKYIESVSGGGGAVGASKELSKAFQSASDQLPILAKRSEAAEQRLKELKEQGKEGSVAFKNAEATVMGYHQKLDKAQASISDYNNAQERTVAVAKKATLSVKDVMAALQNVGELDIPGEIGAESIIRALNEAYGGANQRLVQTFSGQMEKLKDNIKLTALALVGLDENFRPLESGMFSKLTGILTSINDWLDKNQYTIQRWGETLGQNIGVIIALITGLGATFIGFLYGVAGPVIVTAAAIGGVAGAVGLLTTSLIDFSPIMDDVAKDTLPQASFATDNAKEAMNRYGASMMSTIKESDAFMKKEKEKQELLKRFKDSFQPLIDGIYSLISPLGLLNETNDKTKISLETVAGAIRLFATGIQLLLFPLHTLITYNMMLYHTYAMIKDAITGNDESFAAHKEQIKLLGSNWTTTLGQIQSSINHYNWIFGIQATQGATQYVTNYSNALSYLPMSIEPHLATTKASFETNYSAINTATTSAMTSMLSTVNTNMASMNTDVSLKNASMKADVDTSFTEMSKSITKHTDASYLATKNNFSSLESSASSNSSSAKRSVEANFSSMDSSVASASSRMYSSVSGSFSKMSTDAGGWGRGLAGNWLNGVIEGAKGLSGWARDKFKDMTGLQFQHGGIIPGAIGQPVPIIAHGGERIVSRTGTDVGGVSGGSISINFYGSISMDSEERIEELADRISRIMGRQNELARYSAGY